MTCNIALNGFFGRMGQSIFEESKKNSNCLITVGCDIKKKLSNNTFESLVLTSDIEKHSEGFDVVIDFTLPEPSLDLIKKCVRINKPIAIGTTGFSQEQLLLIIEASKKIPILLAPNMSHGVNVSFSALKAISKSLKNYDVSIIETHHKNKVDSPSGTAIKMAEIICDSKNIQLGDVHSKNCPIKFTSHRKNTEIGTHDVIFKSESDKICLTHVANNRSIFALGALDAAVWVSKQQPGLYNYQHYISSKS
jgi:4-hydroxy-tetrahydrodipicolinate reductase